MPIGWEWASLDAVTELNPRFEIATRTDNPNVSFVPMPAVEAGTGIVDVSRTRRLEEVRKGYTHFREGDVLFAKITPCMENGKMAVVPPLENDLGFGSTEFHVLRPYRGISPEYICYLVSSQQFRSQAQHNMTGAVGQRRVPASYLANQSVPIPPAREQRRIVAKIEVLFSELDKGIENLKTARRQLEVYRQSVLKHAFEGKLTAQWREENKDRLETPQQLLARIRKERNASYETKLREWDIATTVWATSGKQRSRPRKPSRPNWTGPSLNDSSKVASGYPVTWTSAAIGSLFDVVSGATPKGLERVEGGDLPYYKVGDMNTPGNETRMDAAAIYLSDGRRSELGLTAHPEGTIIFPKRGGAILTNKKRRLARPACFDLNTMGVINGTASISTDYLWYWFLLLDLSKVFDGSNVPQINNKDIEPLSFPICSAQEQNEIVRILEHTLAVATRMESEINKELSGAETLRHAILQKAFSGQLVPQDPHDEPASILLEKIRLDREKAGRGGPTARRKRKAKPVE